MSRLSNMHQNGPSTLTTSSKSQIAIEFGYRVRLSSPQSWVFWVDAKDAGSIKASYRKIAKAIGIPGYDEARTDVLSLVRDWLRTETNGPWVMIIDSADDPTMLTEPASKPPPSATNIDPIALNQVRDFLTISQNGSVLITSTNTEAAQILTGNCAYHIELVEMNESEALALLKSKLHSKVAYTEEQAKELVEAAEYMPLAISQVAARISMDYPRMNFPKAIQLLLHPEDDVTRLLEGSVHEAGRETGRTNSVIKSWHLSLKYVHETNPSAARLFSLMCLFDRQGIPKVFLAGQYGEDVIASSVPAQPRMPWWRRLKWRQLRKAKRLAVKKISVEEAKSKFEEDWHVLNSLMLIKTNLDGDEFSMHRLIQHTTVRWLEMKGELEAWVRKYALMMRLCFPKPDNQDYYYTMCRLLFPHARKASKYRPSDPRVLRLWAGFVEAMARYASAEGNYSTAEELAFIALRAHEDAAGKQSEDTLRCLQFCGSTLHVLHRSAEAETLFRQVWQAQLASLGEEHLDTLRSAGMVAATLRAQEKWDEYDELSMQILRVRERVFGPTHDEFIMTAMGLSFSYLVAERYKQSAMLLRRIYDISKEQYGEESSEAIDNSSLLASALILQGEAREAEIILRKVVEAREKEYGASHNMTITSLNSLGNALARQGKFDEIAGDYRRVLDMYPNLGPSAQESALEAIESFAQVLSKQGELVEAENLARKVISAREELHGHDHHNTLVAYHTLAGILTIQEQFGPALEMFEKAYVGAYAHRDDASTVEFLNDFNAAKDRLLLQQERDDRTSAVGEVHVLT
jgi:tetratricopeptide (TPR) repeat protein